MKQVSSDDGQKLCEALEAELRSETHDRVTILSHSEAARALLASGRGGLNAIVRHLRGHPDLSAPNVREGWGMLIWYAIRDLERLTFRPWSFADTDHWISLAEKSVVP